MKKLLGILGSVGLFIVLLIAMGVGKIAGRSAVDAMYEPDIDKMLAQAASAVNAKLPMMIDSETRLDSTVPGTGKTFNYLYTMINYSSQAIDPLFISSLAPQVIRKVCGSNDMQKMLSLGVTAVYVYRGNDGGEIGRISANQNDCSAQRANAAPIPSARTASLSTSQIPSPSPTAANSSSIGVVTDLELGSSIGADNRIAKPTLIFAKNDVIHASIATDGPSIVLSTKWTYQDGQLVDSQDINVPAGPQVTDFSISKPDGWPLGHYKVEVSINSSTVASRNFQVVN